MSSEIVDMYQDVVREHGDRVDIDTQVCVQWKLEHKDCTGCSSNLGCAKTAAMLLAVMSGAVYTPTDWNDFQKMNHSIEEKMARIMSAKTLAEVMEIDV